MVFKLSDEKCSVTVTIHVNDEKEPVYGYRACVELAHIRDTTSKRQTALHPTICAQAKSQEAAIGALFKKIYRMMT